MFLLATSFLAIFENYIDGKGMGQTYGKSRDGFLFGCPAFFSSLDTFLRG